MASVSGNKLGKIITNVGKGIKNGYNYVKTNPKGAAIKAVGATALAVSVYDAHVIGKEKSESKKMINGANRFYGDYKYYRASDRESATVGKLKEFRFDTKPYSLYHTKDNITGYAQGFGESIAGKLPIVGLGVLALKFKSAGKAAAIILGVIGAKIAVTDVLGIGEKREKICP